MESNNQLPFPSPLVSPIPAPSTTPVASESQISAKGHTRDPQFYYRDGSVVFLVENTLFKVQASLLAADPEVEEYEFRSIVKDAIDCPQGRTNKPGSDDAHPVVLPADVTATQFRGFLVIIFGGVTNTAFLNFLNTLGTPSSYSPPMTSTLIALGYLGCRFGMKRLDAWIQVQIHRILTHFIVPRRPMDDWDAPSILQLVQYMQSTTFMDYQLKLLGLMRHIISSLVYNASQLDYENPQSKIIDVCAALYKEKELLIKSPGFFGFIFAVIVSLGHQSRIWADCLTREDRRVLYAANSTLTRLGNHDDLDVGWLKDPAPIKKVCSKCSSNFDICWDKTFSNAGRLNSRELSQDIRQVVFLPEYHTMFWPARRNISCGCAKAVMEDIGERIESLYCGLTEKYKILAKTV